LSNWTRRKWELRSDTWSRAHDVEEILRALSSLCAALFLIITFFSIDSYVTLKTSTAAKDEVSGRTFNFLCWVWELILIYNWDERCFYILSLCSLCFRHPVLFAFYSFFSPLNYKLRLQTTLRRVTELCQ